MHRQQLQVPTRAGDLACWTDGDGPPLLFLQGFLATPEVWDPVVARLRDQFRCITVDLPFGAHRVPMNRSADLSPPGIAELVVDVLDGLGLQTATLVGNDAGGVLAQLVVASAPERVDDVVLVACDAFEVFPPGAFRLLFRLAAVPGVVWLLSQALRSSAVRRSKLGFGRVLRHPQDDVVLRSWSTPVATSRGIRGDVAKLMRGSSRDQTLAAAERFERFPGRALVVWAENDQLFSPALGARLAAAFRDGRLETVEDSATLVAADQPDRLAELIADFAGVVERRGEAV